MTPAYDHKQDNMGGPPRGPIWAPKYRTFGIFELYIKENEPRRYSNGFLYGFGSISTKFQPEWTDFGPFQTIFGFWGFFGYHIWTYFLTNIWVSREMTHIWISREADTYMDQPSNETDMSQPVADTIGGARD